jgi:hypothetical protein
MCSSQTQPVIHLAKSFNQISITTPATKSVTNRLTQTNTRSQDAGTTPVSSNEPKTRIPAPEIPATRNIALSAFAGCAFRQFSSFRSSLEASRSLFANLRRKRIPSIATTSIRTSNSGPHTRRARFCSVITVYFFDRNAP